MKIVKTWRNKSLSLKGLGLKGLGLRGLVVFALLGFVNLTAFAQNAGTFGDADMSEIDYRKPVATPVLMCKELVRLGELNFSVISATLVAAQKDLPAYCKVEGVIQPEVRFQLKLPTDWNGRIYTVGNRGLAGDPSDDPFVTNATNKGLRHGFATSYTDTGHTNTLYPGAKFAHDNMSTLVDFSYRAVHVTILVSKQLVRAYYGQDASCSYRDGCSRGGYQGLISSQKYPYDFDGIVAGAPLVDTVATTMKMGRLSKIISKADLSLGQVKHIANVIYEKCDKLDGLEDGLIDDPRQCKFEPVKDVARCAKLPAAGAQCLSLEQAQLLAKFYKPYYVDGNLVHTRMLVGSERGDKEDPAKGMFSKKDTGWNFWVYSEGNPQTIWAEYGLSFLQYMAVEPDQPELELKNIDYDEWARKDMQLIRELSYSEDPDLSAFKKNGGKMITYFGWADQALNPMAFLNYYEAAQKKTKDLESTYRAFMVPGMFHCNGGLGLDSIDAMTPLINWVEAGKAPDQIIAKRWRGGKMKMSRPICPYPQVSKYSGSGDINVAKNFKCQPPGKMVP